MFGGTLALGRECKRRVCFCGSRHMTNLRRIPESCRRTLLLVALATAAASALYGQGQENVKADAILVQDKAILLFTRMATCDENFVPGTSQHMVSIDNGRSWQKRGPR